MGLTSIRDAVPGDGRQIVDLLQRSWLATYVPLGVAESVILASFGDFEQKSQVFDTYLETRDTTRSVAMVMVAEGRVIGMCFAHQAGEFWKLTQLYVDPDYIGQGIGSQLMARFLECVASKGCRLSVAVNNQRAIKFYQAHGFVATDEQTSFTLTPDVSLLEIIMHRPGQ
jgi:ribosomal protein S18 acetylase RimI-like enzyme